MPAGKYVRTKEWRDNRSRLLCGKAPWNKGIKTNTIPKNSWKKGHVPWNAGKQHTDLTIQLLKQKRRCQVMKPHSALAKKKISNTIKLKWQDTSYGKKILKAIQSSPNVFETRALEHLNKVYSNMFVYTGDGSLIVNGRSADAYSKELNIVALFHGVYWHLKKNGLEITNENKRLVEEKDSIPFTKSGYSVVFIWEDELK